MLAYPFDGLRQVGMGEYISAKSSVEIGLPSGPS